MQAIRCMSLPVVHLDVIHVSLFASLFALIARHSLFHYSARLQVRIKLIIQELRLSSCPVEYSTIKLLVVSVGDGGGASPLPLPLPLPLPV